MTLCLPFRNISDMAKLWPRRAVPQSGEPIGARNPPIGSGDRRTGPGRRRMSFCPKAPNRPRRPRPAPAGRWRGRGLRGPAAYRTGRSPRRVREESTVRTPVDTPRAPHGAPRGARIGWARPYSDSRQGDARLTELPRSSVRMGYGVIGSPTVSGSVSSGSSPGIPASAKPPLRDRRGGFGSRREARRRGGGRGQVAFFWAALRIWSTSRTTWAPIDRGSVTDSPGEYGRWCSYCSPLGSVSTWTRWCLRSTIT